MSSVNRFIFDHHAPRHWRLRPLVLALACIGTAPAGAQNVAGFPMNGTVMSGPGSVSIGTPANGLMTISQSVPRGIVNWQSFSIGVGNQVNVVQPSVASVLLNRVTGGAASLIQGRLTSTLAGSDVPGSGGSIYLINPSGVVFSGSSSVSTGGLIASTLDIAGANEDARNAAFMAGGSRLSLGGNPGDADSTARVTLEPGAVVRVGEGGTVGLIGALVRNEGQISVARGTVGLASGAKVTLDFAGDGLTNFTVPVDGLLNTDLATVQATKGATPEQTALNEGTKAQVMNTGTLTADGGRVVLVGGSSLAQQVVNQSGTVQARSLINRGGEIILQGVGPEGSTEPRLQVSGNLDASGTAAGVAGGTVTMTGGSVSVDENTVVDAGGASGRKNGTWKIDSNSDLVVTNDVAAGADVSAVSDTAVGVALGHNTDVNILSRAMENSGDAGWTSTGAGVSIANESSIVKGEGRDASLIVSSATNIFMSGNIGSSAGKLDVDFNADALGKALPVLPAISADEAVRAGAIYLGNASIKTGGGDIRFYGQSDPDNGRAVGSVTTRSGGPLVEAIPIVGGVPVGAITLFNSTLSTCAVGAGCEGGGSITLRAQGETVVRGIALQGLDRYDGHSGIDMIGGSMRTGAGSITLDGRGGIGGAGLSMSPYEPDGGSLQAPTLESGTGTVTLVGSSRSWTGADPVAAYVGYAQGAGEPLGVGGGSGVVLSGANIATGGNVSITGQGGDIGGLRGTALMQQVGAIRDENDNVVGASFGAGAGTAIVGSSIQAGRGRTLSIAGTAGSGAFEVVNDATGTPVVTPGVYDAWAVAVVGAQDKGLKAESGRLTVDGGAGNVLVDSSGLSSTPVLGTGSETGFGGSIDIRGRNVLVASLSEARNAVVINSSGVGQAGTVSVRAFAQEGNLNSGIVALGQGALLQADAVGRGNGGQVSVIGDSSLLAYGTMSARAGAGGGNGGRVETSAPTFELAGLRVDASAPAGAAGTWVIDPYDVAIISGTAAGTLTGNPFLPVAASRIQDGDINAALNTGTSVTITTGTAGTGAGSITLDQGVNINYTAAKGPLTLALTANRDITAPAGAVIQSSGAGGPLNVMFNAGTNVDGTPAAGGGQIVYGGNIYTNGGNVAMTGRTTITDQSGIYLEGTIDTRGGNTLNPDGSSTGGSNANPGGNVQLTGSNSVVGPIGNTGVRLVNTGILTSTGDVTIRGESASGHGVEMVGSEIETTSGTVTVTGQGRTYNTSGVVHPTAGVLISSGTIGTVSGGITLRGLVDDTQAVAGSAGVELQGSTLRTTGGGAIEVTGQALASGNGVLLQPPAIAGGPAATGGIAGSGQVVLRASNDGSTDAIAIAAPVAAGTVLNLRPGGVDATGGGVDRVANPITLGGSAATGFALSAAELALLGAPTMVVGSDAHAGRITVEGAMNTASALTLQNQGGAGGIQLNAPVSTPRLGLLSGGDVTQTAAAPITVGTLLASSSGGSVLLDQAANNVSANTLGGGAAGSFRYQDVDALRIGAVSVAGFGAGSNQPQVASATSMAADSVYVRTLSGDLTLATNISSNSGTDLVAAARFQNVGASTVAGAPWRIWADTWVGETRGGLAGSGFTPNLFGCTYLGACGVVVTPADNHFIYTQQPRAIVTIRDETRAAGAANPLFGYTVTGMILGDTASGFSGTPGTAANASSPPGLYAINGSFASAAGYLVDVVPGTLTVTDAVPPVTFRLPTFPSIDLVREFEGNNTYTFDRNLGAPPICFATGPRGGDRSQQGDDLLAREWSRVRSRPNLTSCVDTERKNGCADF